MPMYDRRCQSCGILRVDVLEPIVTRDPLCECGGTLIRVFTQRAPATIADSIPGGINIKHGLCNPDGTPRRFDSKSDIRREAKARGLENMVRHVAPYQDSDKSPHTIRWDAPLLINEEERVKAWWEHERLNGFEPPKGEAPQLGVGVVVEENRHVSEIIADSIRKIESSGFNEAQYRGVNPPEGGFGSIRVGVSRD